MKIGIFGGSFNPPHKIHKEIGMYLVNSKYLDKVIYVPTGDKYEKKDLISSNNRIDMLKIMIKNNNYLEVSDYEIKNNLVYTYQTLDYFKNKYKDSEIYFICGSDNLREFKTWKKFNYILNNYRLIVFKRNDDNIEKILENLNIKNIIVIDKVFGNLSSTYIRKELEEGKNVLNLVDNEVVEYIENNKLYNFSRKKVVVI